MLTLDQEATLTKLTEMNSLPGIIAWGTPADVGSMSGGFAGSRTQETQARRAYTRFLSMGGQAELDRLRLLILTDPVLNAEWNTRMAANKGDWFSAIGDTFVSLVPTALKVAIAVAAGDIITGGTLISATAAPAVTSTGSTVAATSVTTAGEVAASQGVIAQMTGAGISDAVIAQSAAQAAASAGVASSGAAIAEMTAASWGTLTTGATALPVISSVPNISLPQSSSAPSAPSIQSASPSVPSASGYSTITESLVQVAPKAFDVATQVAMASLAPKKTAQSAPTTAPDAPAVYDNTALYLIGGVAAVIIAVVLIK